mgnify:FL=1
MLITLGIIGIVAAITLPPVMAKVERNILKQQFKKAYSIYSQAFLKTVNDNDGVLSCYYAENENEVAINTGQYIKGCAEFYENFAKNLKVIKKCDENALSEGCLPTYPDATITGCPGFSTEALNVTSTVYVITDGSILIPYKDNGTYMPLFAFDINGKKGPNKAGFDLFSLHITRTAKGMYRLNANNGNGTGCLPYLDGRITYEEIMFK